ncbi:hypothetical protein CR205_05895 [Alteribacter lacisalsi]|uniref:Uncharacterized protein n=1 Tax=Alteribacter lacisalsi TaxID=2045244 RepID=A0A2W0HKT7_9BACI|nr:hypothetical protein [Alteribacter lacisalsi]PYZ98125.1 hypothetical protein CR205_05895 [Alteribacter lacisalsi]
MQMIDHSYLKRQAMKAWFDEYPNSPVIFRVIGHYYFVYRVYWSENDPIVDRESLIEMELILNKKMGTHDAYLSRRRMV